jgi:predicted DNA-binding protein (MmcQ/YjbR family)
MLTKRGLIDYCLAFPGAFEDYPFDVDSASEEAWTVMRHRTNKKSFAFIFMRGGLININLKCEPMYADLLRSVYPSVIPAYHMNKVHWNGVIIDGSIPDEEIFSWICLSYELIKPKQKLKQIGNNT